MGTREVLPEVGLELPSTPPPLASPLRALSLSLSLLLLLLPPPPSLLAASAAMAASTASHHLACALFTSSSECTPSHSCAALVLEVSTDMARGCSIQPLRATCATKKGKMAVL